MNISSAAAVVCQNSDVNLVLLDERDRIDSHCVTLSDARAAHVVNVLRATPGQTVRIGLLDGPFGTGTVVSAGEGRVTLRCEFAAAAPHARKSMCCSRCLARK